MASPREAREKDWRTAIDTAGSESTSDQNLRKPTHEEIAIAAYQLYISRGGGDGGEIEDWLQAERELSGLPEEGKSENPQPKSKSTTA